MINLSKNTIIFFTTYCNTQEKQNILVKNLEFIKKSLPDIQIGVHAHYPLDIQVQSLTNHYIFDVSNPMSPSRNLYLWVKLFDQIKITQKVPDFGYAALSQLKMISNYVQSLDHIENIIFLNYDVNLTNFTKFLEFIENKSNVFFDFHPISNSNKFLGVNFVGMKTTKDFIFNVLKDTKLEHYDTSSSHTIEDFLRKKLLDNDPSLKFFDKGLLDSFIPTLISSSHFRDLCNIDNNLILKYFSSITFVSNTLLIWDIIKTNYNFEILINNQISQILSLSEDDLPIFQVPLNLHQIETISLTKIENQSVDYLIYDKNLKNSNEILYINEK